jgi:hypothetical protein
MSSDNKKRVSISLHPEIMAWAKKRAKHENRTFSNLVETLLSGYRDKTVRFINFTAAEKGK